jgi:hypothetical protein
LAPPFAGASITGLPSKHEDRDRALEVRNVALDGRVFRGRLAALHGRDVVEPLLRDAVDGMVGKGRHLEQPFDDVVLQVAVHAGHVAREFAVHLLPVPGELRGRDAGAAREQAGAKDHGDARGFSRA